MEQHDLAHQLVVGLPLHKLTEALARSTVDCTLRCRQWESAFFLQRYFRQTTAMQPPQVSQREEPVGAGILECFFSWFRRPVVNCAGEIVTKRQVHNNASCVAVLVLMNVRMY
jgi:hypothetical protein